MPSFSASDPAGIDMARLWPGTSGDDILAVVTQTATLFRITLDAGGGATYDVAYYGSGFTYTGTPPNVTATGGTYTQVQILATGGAVALATLSGVSQPLADIDAVRLTTLVPLAGNDTITGSSAAGSNDVLRGGAGNDTITDSGGATRNIDAGAGDDVIFIGSGAPSGTVRGGSGTDTLVATHLGGVTLSAIEILETRGGTITGTAAQFEAFTTIRSLATAPTAAVRLTLVATGAATTASLASELNSGGPRAATITGSTDSESITTGDGADVINAGAGDDRLYGGDGNDTLTGGDGNDSLYGGTGTNVLNGDAGNDLFLSSANTAITFNGGSGEDEFRIGVGLTGTVNGGTGTDTMRLPSPGFNLTTLSITDVEILQVGNAVTLGYAAQFAGFDTIFTTFPLIFVATGGPVTVDLTAQFATGGPGGGPRAVSITGSDDAETITTGAANETVSGGAGNDVVRANAGNDQVTGGFGDDLIFGGSGDDQLFGNEDNDTLHGGDGNDGLTATYAFISLQTGELVNGGDNALYGGTGDDSFTFRPRSNGGNAAGGIIDGGSGNNMLLLSAVHHTEQIDITHLTISNVQTLEIRGRTLALASQLEAFDTIQAFADYPIPLLFSLAASGQTRIIDLNDEIEAGNARGLDLIGSTDNEDVRGSRFADTISGGAGNDTLFGGGGNDTLNGGTGANALFGGAGNDLFIVGELLVSAAGDDDINGGIGIDTADFEGVTNPEDLTIGVTVVLGPGGTWTFGTLIDIENVITGGGNDTITGSSGANSLNGGANQDLLFGGAGNDLLDGSNGRDTMEGGLGNDFYIVDDIGDVIRGEIGFAQGGGIDTVRVFISNFLQPDNIELVRLGNLTDTVPRNVTGNDAPGTLVGNDGSNILNGRGGNDQINGNGGNDTLIGGEGADTLVGGAGADSFVFSSISNSRPGAAARDFINGFDRGAVQDRIDLSAIDANTLTAGVNNAFTFIGAAAFALGGASAGQLRLVGLGGANAVIVEADINGDRVADFQIFVNGQLTMVAGDFIL